MVLDDYILLRNGKKKYIFFYKANLLFPKEVIEEENKVFFEKLKRFVKDFNERGGIIKRQQRRNVLKELINARHLLLDVTERCNLRCRYCVYSGNYRDKRLHSSKDMSWEIAKKSIDFIIDWSLKHFDQRTSPYTFTIGFYGGEPLLNFEVIKRTVEYVREKEKEHDKFSFRFNMTTNGTLVDRYIDFLVENNFDIEISIDGPEEVMNKNCGEGVFEKVYNNIKMIRGRHPDYYKKRVGFSVVYARDTDLRKVYEFFKDELFEECSRIDIGYVVEEFSVLRFPGYGINERDVVMEIMEKKLKGKKLKKIEEGIMSMYFGFAVNVFNIKNYGYYGATCILGSKVVYVTSEGKFLGCEKGRRSFVIGDVERGFDIEKIEEIDRKFIEATKDCGECILQGTCYACVANTGCEGEIRKKEYCKGKRENFLNKIMEYMEV